MEKGIRSRALGLLIFSLLVAFLKADIVFAQQSLGCFNDDISRTVLYNGVELVVPQLTIEGCATACAAKGFLYAGTENGTACFCGNTVDDSRLGRSAGCNKPCPGNLSENCGGLWALHVTQSRAARVYYSQPNAPLNLTPNTPNWQPAYQAPNVTLSWWNAGTANQLYAVSSWLYIRYYDISSRSWKPYWSGYVLAPSLYGQMNQAVYVSPNSYYAWRVFDVDPAHHTAVWYAASNFAFFHTR